MNVEFKIGRINNKDVYHIGKTGNMNVYSDVQSHLSSGDITFYFVDDKNRVKNTLKIQADCCQNYGDATFNFNEVVND